MPPRNLRMLALRDKVVRKSVGIEASSPSTERLFSSDPFSCVAIESIFVHLHSPSFAGNK
jgi:hypothetical protein